MSYILSRQKCGNCSAEWNSAVGVVGTTQIAAAPTKCPHCGSTNFTKISDSWEMLPSIGTMLDPIKFDFPQKQAQDFLPQEQFRHIQIDYPNNIASIPIVGKLIYLASPYTHENMDIRVERFNQVLDCCGWFMNHSKNEFFYSPIAHTHPIAMRCTLPGEWQFWSDFDECILSRCNEIWILTLPGFSKSTGVKAERKIAERFGLPVRFIIKNTDGSYTVTDTEPEDVEI
jgi:DNA-directed RNA polymerase subunit RPC12/RpoP